MNLLRRVFHLFGHPYGYYIPPPNQVPPPAPSGNKWSQPPTPHYKLVQVTGLDKLADAVCQAMDAGYVPVGGVFSRQWGNEHQYIQPVYKPGRIEVETHTPYRPMRGPM